MPTPHKTPCLSFKSYKTSAFHNFTTNYSASSSINDYITLITLSGFDLLNNLFYTNAMNFS